MSVELADDATIRQIAERVLDMQRQIQESPADATLFRLNLDAVKGECAPALARWIIAQLDAPLVELRTEPIRSGDVTPIGEPGCYAVEGHLDWQNALRMLAIVRKDYDYSEEEYDTLSDPRHGWMIVRESTEDDDCGEGGYWYREVLPDTAEAVPYTIIECVGYWQRPVAS